MMTLGIDVGKDRHNATLINDDGRKLIHNETFENNQEGVDKLIAAIEAVNVSTKAVLVGMEATGHYWMNLFAALDRLDFVAVELINPIIMHARRNESVRGAKTDRLDAHRIAKYLHEADHRVSAIAEGEVAELRRLARLRYDLSHSATSEKMRIISLLDQVFPEYRHQFSNIFGVASLKVLAEFPTAEVIARVDVRRLTRILKTASRGRFGRDKAQRLKRAARRSFAACKTSQALQIAIKYAIQQLNMLLDQVAELDKILKSFLKAEQEILQSIPGIGGVWAPMILAEIMPIFQPENVDGSRKLVAHAGLDAMPRLSGRNNSRQGGSFRMSKRGSKYLRTAVIQASNVAALTHRDPMFGAIYDRQKAKGKAHLVALSHVAHKMLHVIFAILRDKKTYKPVIYQRTPRNEAHQERRRALVNQ